VIAAVLPIDVQVDPREWRKYRTRPVDLAATEPLLSDFIADATDADVKAINLLPTLRAASPGAFLPDDYHLSSKGHAAIARALAAALDGRSTLARNEVIQ
jgi:hypothetical protein